MDGNAFFATINDSIAGRFGGRPVNYTPQIPPPVFQDGGQPAPPPPPPFQPPTDEEIKRKIQAVVCETSKKYKRDNSGTLSGLMFFDGNFTYCPFCGALANWSCNSSDDFKGRFRCDTCLAELYGTPHTKKIEKNNFMVASLGYYNRSDLELNKTYNLEQITAFSCQSKNGDERNE